MLFSSKNAPAPSWLGCYKNSVGQGHHCIAGGLKEIIQEQHGLRFLGMIVKALMANNAYHNFYPWSKTCLFQNFLRFLMISSIKNRLKNFPCIQTRYNQKSARLSSPSLHDLSKSRPVVVKPRETLKPNLGKD